MRIGLVHNLLGAIANLLDTKLPADEATMLNNIYVQYSTEIGGGTNGVSSTGDDDAVAETEDAPVAIKLDLDQYSSEDPMIADAHAAVMVMAKPTKKGIQEKCKVSAKRAKEMFESLQADGYINEHGNTVPLDMVKKNKPTEVTADNIETMLDNLPAGDDVMLTAPFNMLLALDEKRRKPYLTAVDLTTVLTSDSVARAVKNGADTTLVRMIIDRADKSVKSVKDPIAVDNSAKGKDVGKKIAQRVSIIGELGEVLFNHMVRGGFNKTVYEDLTEIAKAVKAGTV